MKLNGYALRYIAPELEADRAFGFKAVKKDAYARKHAAPELKVDREFIFGAWSRMNMHLDTRRQSSRRTVRSRSQPSSRMENRLSMRTRAQGRP